MSSPDRQPSSITPYLIPSLADILFICVLCALCLKSNLGMLNDGDTGYHIRAGEYILKTFSLPRFDSYSFIAPAFPWTVHEWLSEVFMALFHQSAGLAGVVAFYSFLLALTYYLFVRMLQAVGVTPLVAVATAIIVIVPSTVHWLARPHVLSLLIIVIWCWILDAYEERNRQFLYYLPPLMLLWVNAHGGYIIGFVLLGVYLANAFLHKWTDRPGWQNGGQERFVCYVKVLFSCVVAALMNPFGYNIFLFPFKLISDKYLMNHVNEFLSPNFHENTTFRLLLLALLLILGISRRRLTFIQSVLAILFTNMALYSVRYIPLFALIVVPIMLRHIDLGSIEHFPKIMAFFRKRAGIVASIDSRARGFFWPAAATGLVMVTLLNGAIVHGFDPKSKAVDAVNFMKREHIIGEMFNNDEIGDLIIYEAHQQYKVFIDGRLDMYGTKHLKEYFKVKSFSPGWETLLQKYGITWIIFDTDTEFVRHLCSLSDWKLIYSDKVASILVKNVPEYAPLIARHQGVQLAKIERKE